MSNEIDGTAATDELVAYDLRHTDGSARAIVGDDEDTVRDEIVHALANAGYDAETAAFAAAALVRVPSFRPHLLLTEVRLPDATRVSLMVIALQVDPHFEAVVMTRGPGIESAVRADADDCA